MPGIFVVIALLLFVVSACVEDDLYGGITFEGDFRRPIPFEQHAGLAVVQVRVDGSTPRSFIVDSGAQYVLLGEAFATELGYGGGTLGETLVVLDELTLGSVTYQNVTAAPYDLSSLDSILDEELAGIIGSSLLQYFTFAIDHQREVLFVLDADDEQTVSLVDESHVGPVAMSAGFDTRLGWPLARARFEGGESLEVIIDTGASATALFQSYFDSIDNVSRPFLSGPDGVGVGGVFATDRTRICGLDVGEAWVSDVPINVIPDSVLGDARDVLPSLAGLLGFTFMRDFLTVLDYPEGEARFYRFSEPGYDHETEFVQAGLILRLSAGGDVVVAVVYNGTDAEAQDIREGDIVSTINGDWARLYDEDELDALLRGEVGETVLLEISHNGAPAESVEVLIEDLLPLCETWYER